MHMLVLIGSDGKRATVSRAIATEASYVLRDLLDAESILLHQKKAPCPTSSASLSPIPYAHNEDQKQQHSNSEIAIPDLMDFNDTDPETTTTTAASTAATKRPLWDGVATDAWNASVIPVSNSSYVHPTDEATVMPDSVYGRAVELPFPCLTGDILERVCYHMSYRFRISTFGVEDNLCRVYPVKTRDLPKPLVLPLNEYLDSNDRRFIADWDEKMTVWMVKAAMLLNYEELLQLASAKLASYLCEKNVHGLRTLLRVEGDFTAPEEAGMKKELQGSEGSRTS